MISVRMILLGGLLGIVSQAALAFTETTSGGQTAAPAGSSKAVPGVDLSTPPAARTIGPEIKLPGLGTIGALPKLDFGLELLYGASPQNNPQLDKNDRNDKGDAQIRGTLKYRFPN